MNTSKRAQEITRRRPKSFNGIRVNFAYAISVIISRSLMLTVTNRAVFPLDLVVALPFIGVTVGVTGGRLLSVAMHMLVQGLTIRTLTYAQAALPTLPANRANHRWPIIFIVAMTTSFVGSTTRWIKRIAVLFAFFPPRSETSRRFRCLRQSVTLDSTLQTHWLGCVCANDGHRGVKATVPGQAQSKARLCRSHVTTRRGVAGRGCCQRRSFSYRDCRLADKVGSDNRPALVCECETSEPVPLLHHSQGTASHLDESISSSIRYFLVHPANRLLGRSFPNINMHRLIT